MRSDSAAFENDYWRTTNDPTEFRAYIEDREAGLIPGVQVRALLRGISATSDENGLFTLEVPASYRKGKAPSVSVETLIFSKPGYQTLQYRDVVLNPGVAPLEIVLEKGTGTEVRRNLSLSNNGQDEVFTFKRSARRVPEGYSGEIFSFEIEPPTYDGGWNLCQSGAKAVLRGRNLKSVEIFFYSTGTGIGETGPASAGQMNKVRTSPQQEIWELSVPDILATNFWAQAIDTNGKTIKSIDLGPVGRE